VPAADKATPLDDDEISDEAMVVAVRNAEEVALVLGVVGYTVTEDELRAELAAATRHRQTFVQA
jgi:hypothetical protein